MITGITTSAAKNSRQSFIPRRQTLIPPPSPSGSLNKRRPLLDRSRSSCSSCCSGSFAEVAGGATAECAAVCCCCPCGLMNFLILTIYKVPAGLCRRALLKKRRRHLMKKGLLPLPSRTTRRCRCGCDDTEIQIHPTCESREAMDLSVEDGDGGDDDEEEMVRLEKEMWERFYGTGFWRSPSARESSSS